MPNSFISLSEAIQLTSKYRGSMNDILQPQFQNKGILPICESFDRDYIDKLLCEEGCTGLRFYFGMDESMLIKLVVVGVNAENEDMLPPASTEPASTTTSSSTETPPEGSEDGLILENGYRCPTQCPPPSVLNS